MDVAGPAHDRIFDDEMNEPDDGTLFALFFDPFCAQLSLYIFDNVFGIFEDGEPMENRLNLIVQSEIDLHGLHCDCAL